MMLSQDSPKGALEGPQEVQRSLLGSQRVRAVVPRQPLAAPWTAGKGVAMMPGALLPSHKHTVWTAHAPF